MKDLALVPGSAHPLAMVELQPGAALVTGAAHRIGQAIAEDLAGRGWAVALHYHRSRETAMAMATRIIAAGGQATAVPADLTDEEEAADLVPRAAAAVGPLDCLINNAAVFENDDIETATHESWDTHILTNLRAPLILTQTFAAQLDGQVSGNVINLLDQRVWEPHAAFPVLYGEQGGALGADANGGAGLGAAYPRQRYRAGSDAAESPSVARAVRRPKRRPPIGTGDDARGNLRRRALYPCGARANRPNDSPGWRPTSGLVASRYASRRRGIALMQEFLHFQRFARR